MKNPPAFPGKQKALMIQSEHIGIANEYEIEHNGMTLRDYFAAKAMQGAINTNGFYDDELQFAKWCYETADAMLKAREA